MKKHFVLQWVTLAIVVGYAWTPTSYAQNSNGSQVSPDTRLRYVGKNRPSGEVWPETNLYFGSSKPDGTAVTPEFNNFLDHKVTPRFPDGLTLLVGLGECRNSSGTILNSVVIERACPGPGNEIEAEDTLPANNASSQARGKITIAQDKHHHWGACERIYPRS